MSDERCDLDNILDDDDSLGDIPEDMDFREVACEIMTKLRKDLHRRYCPLIGHAEWASRMSQQFVVAAIATIVIGNIPENSYDAVFPIIIREIKKSLDRVRSICESIKDNGIN